MLRKNENWKVQHPTVKIPLKRLLEKTSFHTTVLLIQSNEKQIINLHTVYESIKLLN